MITSQITLVAVPKVAWSAKTQLGMGQIDIQEFVQDAIAIERRIAKGVNLDNERNRYSLCCSRLEAALRIPDLQYITDEAAFDHTLAKGRLPAITLDTIYLDELEKILQMSTPDEEACRLGSSFHPPELLLDHVRGFYNAATRCQLQNHPNLQTRLKFLQWAANTSCGVVEIDNPYGWVSVSPVAAPTEKSAAQIFAEQENILDLGESEDLDDELIDNTGRSAYLILREQVMHAIQCALDGQPAEVNFSNQPHEVITEVLHEFISSGKPFSTKPIYIQVVYTDGSRGRPFPLGCIPETGKGVPDPFQKEHPLKAALLSMRHLALDSDIDMAWFRNREVSKARAFGETDEFCYQKSLQQFRDARSEEPLLIHLYQTGLQPAIIGFYRALIEEVLEREDKDAPIRVVPFFFRKSGHYAQGKPWG